MNFKSTSVIQMLKWFIVISSIIFFTLRFRDKIKHGIITYKTSLWFGTLLSFFTGVLSSFFTFCLFKFWDSGLFEQLLEIQEKQLRLLGFKDIYIENQINNTTPFLASISFVFSIGIWGFIFSLIFSIFAKRLGNPFDDTSIHTNQFPNTDSN